MHGYYHITISALISLLFVSESRGVMLVCFLSGWIIDMDHIPDYIRIHKRFDLIHFLKNDWYEKRVYIVLHSIELAILLVIISAITLNPWIVALTVGYGTHIMIDAAANRRTTPSRYFWIKRMI